MTVRFDDQGAGLIRVCGPLNLATAGAALTAGQQVFATHDNISADLAGVEAGDSAGLAVLLEWAMWAHGSGKRLAYGNVPANLMAIAQISEVDHLLPLAEVSARPGERTT